MNKGFDTDASRADQYAKQLITEAWTYVLADPKGRRFIRWLLAITGEDQSVSCDNALRLARLSGRRDVGLEVRTALETMDPDHWDELVKEGRNDRSELDSLRAADDDSGI